MMRLYMLRCSPLSRLVLRHFSIMPRRSVGRIPTLNKICPFWANTTSFNILFYYRKEVKKNMILESLVCLLGAMVPFAILAYSNRLKIHAIDKICDHPELSDDKVKSITKIASKDLKLK